MEISDVGAEFPNLRHGAGFVLSIRDGVVTMMEGFTYDEPWPESQNEFRLFRQQTVKNHRLSHQSKRFLDCARHDTWEKFPVYELPFERFN
jgi:hypothetical protein